MIDAVSGRVFSYRLIRQLTRHYACALRRHGYAIGAKASVLSNNDPIGYATVLSLMRAGLTWIPLNPRNTPQDLGAILQAFDCEVLFFLSKYADQITQIAQLAPNIREFVCIDGNLAGYPALETWAAGVVDSEVALSPDSQRLFAIQPTGGTTGFPKGVMLSNGNVEYIVNTFTAMAPCVAPPVFVAVSPLTHGAGMMFQYVMAHGGTAIVFPTVDRQLVLESIPKYRATHTFLPPTLLYDLLAQANVRDFDYASLRCIAMGAAPVAPAKLREALTVFGPVLYETYGQTETGFPNTIMLPIEHFVNDDMHAEFASPQRLASCGRCAPYCRVEIMNETGGLLANGEIGEIVVRGAGVMQGYYKNPPATQEASRFGWHHTGDLAWRDDDGFFYIVDRLKDMIISGGFNIYSAQVERAVLMHPAVQDCAVIGVPDERWGEAVKAVVQLKPGASASAQEIIAACKDAVGGMKAPKSVDFVTELPRSPAGKVLKREVRKPYWQSRDRQVS
jgi:acyl-CoA synthetase (AMP-forming)/AMP-acid ligase II